MIPERKYGDVWDKEKKKERKKVMEIRKYKKIKVWNKWKERTTREDEIFSQKNCA